MAFSLTGKLQKFCRNTLYVCSKCSTARPHSELQSPYYVAFPITFFNSTTLTKKYQSPNPNSPDSSISLQRMCCIPTASGAWQRCTSPGHSANVYCYNSPRWNCWWSDGCVHSYQWRYLIYWDSITDSLWTVFNIKETIWNMLVTISDGVSAS